MPYKGPIFWYQQKGQVMKYMIQGTHAIPELVSLYQPLLVRCARSIELIPHLKKVINDVACQEIDQISRTQGDIASMECLLNHLEKSNHPKKWHKFVDALEKKEYKYVAVALKGKEIPTDVYVKYRKILKEHIMSFLGRFDPSEVLAELNTRKVINDMDKENIEAEIKTGGNICATNVLLDRVWRHQQNWYKDFLEVLLCNNYVEIVKEMDQEFYENWHRKSFENRKDRSVDIPIQNSNSFQSSSSELRHLVTEDTKYRYDIPEIEIVKHPTSCTVRYGQSCTFTCEAHCKGVQLHFKWYKDGRPLQGANKSVLNLGRIQDKEKQGNYMCMVSVPNRDISCHSNVASLHITTKATTTYKPCMFSPTDKFALLIGNYDYPNRLMLNTTETDVLTLAHLFKKLQFNVISLLNLSKTEMLSIVDYFSELLDKGMYVVFYFCGLGFEENGCCYFVPTDSKPGYTSHDCVSAEEILCRLQVPDPDLIVMIIDVSRRKGSVESVGSITLAGIPNTGNTVICYATSPGMCAYEDSVNGILVKHLQKFILQDKSVLDIFIQVQESVGKKPTDHKYQIPEIRSRLSQPKRSLADKISLDRGKILQLSWVRCQKKPQKTRIPVPDLMIELEMDFQSKISNVLEVITTVKSWNPVITMDAVAFISKVPKDVSLKEKEPEQIPTSPTQFKSTLHGIQRLTEDLIIEVTCKTTDQDASPKIKVLTHNLGLPLVAPWKLWKLKKNTLWGPIKSSLCNSVENAAAEQEFNPPAKGDCFMY